MRFTPHNGFSLVEVMVAVVVLGTLAGSSIWALIQSNNYAAVARLNTGAQVAAQNKIDRIMSTGPFNPQHKEEGVAAPQLAAWKDADGVIHEELKLGVHPVETVTIYTEPSSASNNFSPLVVTGQLTTEVKDTSVNVVGAGGKKVTLYSAAVTVKYYWKGRPKPYVLQLNAVRASDIDGSF